MRHRALDLVICALALPFLALAGAIVAIAVFLDSPGPVLYRSPRIGRGGRPFAMLKFRTMRHGVTGPPLSIAGDDRYTPLGRFLARHRLDELPQVINVLRGEMRLVGPRPEVAEFVAAYPEQYDRVLQVLPGVTGPAQLQYAGEGETLAASDDRVALYRESILPAKIEIDLRYVEYHPARADLALLARTMLLPLARLRTSALLSAPAQTRPAPATFAMLGLAVLAVALAALFAVEALTA